MAKILHSAVQKILCTENPRNKICFCIDLFMKVVFKKPTVHQGGANCPDQSTWTSFRPHMWTRQLFAWHMGIIRRLVLLRRNTVLCHTGQEGSQVSGSLGFFFPASPQRLCFYCLCLLKAGVMGDLFNSDISQALWSQAMSEGIRYSFFKLRLKKKQQRQKKRYYLIFKGCAFFSPKASWPGCFFFK